MPLELPQPWRAFLTELDRLIDFEVTFHCLGGFVVTACYGLARTTGDFDVLFAFSAETQTTLLKLAGRNSELHGKHGVYLDVVTVATYPANYEERLTEV